MKCAVRAAAAHARRVTNLRLILPLEIECACLALDTEQPARPAMAINAPTAGRRMGLILTMVCVSRAQFTTDPTVLLASPVMVVDAPTAG